MANQMTMFETETNTPLAKACDAYLKARSTVEDAKEDLLEKTTFLSELMLAERKKVLRHSGVVISVREIDAKTTLSVKAN